MIVSCENVIYFYFYQLIREPDTAVAYLYVHVYLVALLLDSIYDELNFFVRGAAKFGALRCWMTNVGENACQGSQGLSELVHSSV